MNPDIRALLIDDDPDARALVADLLADHPDFEIVGECSDGVEGVRLINSLRPDVVFIDVQMPRLDGFEVVETVGPQQMPLTVFTTSYAEFALRAFEAYAIDYLVKPIEEARFKNTIERVRSQVRRRKDSENDRLKNMMTYVRAAENPAYPEVIAIKVGDQYRFVEVAEIDYLEADRKYTRVTIKKSPLLLHRSLAAIESHVLDPARFIRIHRSCIVNLARIAFVEPYLHGELSVALKDGTRLSCSRRYRVRLQQLVPFTS